MKYLVTILLFSISINLFGQEVIVMKVKQNLKYSEDSEIEVIDKNSEHNQYHLRKPAYFVDGVHVNEQAIQTFNHDKIKSVNVENEDFKLKGKEYCGKVNIKIKKNFKPNFISLEKLAQKYLSIENNIRIFQIDDTVVDQNESEYLVDENYILRIERTTIKNQKSDSDIDFIKLVTKSPENLEKANRIIIRGS